MQQYPVNTLKEYHQETAHQTLPRVSWSSSTLPHRRRRRHRPPWVAFQPEIHHPFGAVKGFKVVQDLASLLQMFRALESLRGSERHSNHLDISGLGKEHYH